MFAVAAGFGIDERIKAFEAQNDDYSAIVLKALADRLAEGFAEHMQARLRREFWGYAKDENLTNDQLIDEQYLGIRPAPGYPACPDHTEKGELFRVLNATENAGIVITESFAMVPTVLYRDSIWHILNRVSSPLEKLVRIKLKTMRS